MVNINKNDCCGCSSCAQACPRQCIEMRRDDEGFLYPYVDKSNCIECHLCERRCPALNEKKHNMPDPTGLLVMNKNEDRLKSSSGGVFVLIAKQIIADGGVVIGAAFDEKWNVNHKICEREDELVSLMGSKYLQSKNENAYITAKDYLEKGKPVMYIGTACQTAGLNTFLQKKYETLFTVDILCHGVPSPGVWQKYLHELEDQYHSEIKNISFRDKTHGWHTYSVTVSFKNGENYSEVFYKNPYMRLFLSNHILRPSCHSCKYKSLDRPSDLTIGDAWGVENICTEMDDDKGTSIVLVHSEKGQKMMETISESIVKKEIDIEKILPATADSRRPVNMAMGRRLAFFYFRHNKSIEMMCTSMDMSLKSKILRRIIRN